MKQVKFSAGRDSKWSNRFRQACKAGGIVRDVKEQKTELEDIGKTELNGVEEGRNVR